MIDLRTGKEVPFPEGSVQRVDEAKWRPVRTAWDEGGGRGNYIKQWYDWFKERGQPAPEIDWSSTDIHHIRPIEFGGQNEFDNLVPLPRAQHQGPAPDGVTAWWNDFDGC